MAYESGNGVAADLSAAIGFHDKACGDASMNEGARSLACVESALAMLRRDFFGEHEVAMRRLATACAIDTSRCEIKDAHQGTGVRAVREAPHGAVGFEFGIERARAKKLCTEGRGKLRAGRTRQSIACDGYFVEALSTSARYITLDFCDKDELCGIDVALPATPDDVVEKYMDAKTKLEGIYKLPTRIDVSAKPECRTAVGRAIADCIEQKALDLSARWEWESNGLTTLTVLMLAAGGSVEVVLSYDSPAKNRKNATRGL